MKKVNIIDLDNVYKDIIKNVKNKRRIYEFEKYNDSCVVKCTGTTRTVEFDYTLIKYYK